MSPREYSEARLQSILDEIAKLLESDFPYPHSREALNLLQNEYRAHLAKIGSLAANKDPAIVNGLCSEALLDIFRYIPLLGFILRSTNVRNAFEVHGPILRLSQQVVGIDTKLIVSSEWDFSPFIFTEQRPLPNFVLIGLPAPETDNPLLLPLAGHELGHTIWQLNDLEAKHYAVVEQNIVMAIEANISEYQRFSPNHQVNAGDKASQLNGNMFVKRTIAPVVTMAVARAQEYFCDCIGVYLFDEAFFYAYAYLVSPCIGCPRPWEYPNNLARVQNMVNAATNFRKGSPNIYKVPTDYQKMFEDSPEPGDPEQRYLSDLADISSQRLCPTLISDAEALLKGVSAPQLDPMARNFVVDEFRQGVPASNVASLTNILNGGWAIYNEPKFWPDIVDAKQRKKVLGNLVVKNIELLEIEHRTK